MGWWGYGIMEGDTPLDVEADWQDQFGGGIDWDDPDEKMIPLRENITSDEVRNFVNELFEKWDNHHHIIGQVVGLKVMENGIPMDAGLRKGIVLSVTDELTAITNEDMTGCERESKLKSFLVCVEAYPEQGLHPLEGNPFLKTLPGQAGLFETIAAGISN